MINATREEIENFIDELRAILASEESTPLEVKCICNCGNEHMTSESEE